MDMKPNDQTSNTEPTWERKILEKLLFQVYKEQKSARTWKWIKRILWILILLIIIFSIINFKTNITKQTSSHIAVIDLYGTVDDYNRTAEKIIDGLENIYQNPHAKGVIIRANSPGGSPVISDTAFQEIQRMKKAHTNIPIYVVVEDICASGCYYIASAADKIYANPSSIVGSIGVIGGGFGFTELMNKLGIERRLKTAGKNKGIGDPFTPETPEQTAIWQDMLTDIHGQFIEAVKTGRGKALKWQNDDDVFSGRIYTGLEGKKIGLIDDFGTIYSVSRDVLKEENIVDYTPIDSLSDRLGRNLGTEIKQTVKTIIQPSW